MFKLRKEDVPPKELEEYFDTIRSLLHSDEVKSMDAFIQHGTISTLEHSLYVSYLSYKICKRLKLDWKSAARGALLHDFFLYDWHAKDNGIRWHGFIHPKIAFVNASQHFDLNKIEADIIIKHMWPLTPMPPRYIESLFVLIVDKYCAALETLSSSKPTFLKKFKRKILAF